MSITRTDSTDGAQGATGPAGSDGATGATGATGASGGGGMSMVRSFGDPVAVPVDTETTLAVVVPTGDGGSIFLEGIIQFNTPVAGSITDPVNGAIEIILRCYEGTDNTGLQIGSSWELSLDSALAAAIFNMSGAWSDSAITGAQPYAMTVQYAALGTDDGTASLSMLEAWVPGA